MYSTDSSGFFNEELDNVGADSYSLSESDTKIIRSAISEYRAGFKLSDYNEIEHFRYNLENSLLKMTTAGLLKKANKLLKNNNQASLNMVKAGKYGIVSGSESKDSKVAVKKVATQNPTSPAGRLMSRTRAKEQLDMETYKEVMKCLQLAKRRILYLRA